METSNNLSNIWRFDLRRGNSSHPLDGACFLDAVSWFEYGTLGDHPACVCPVLAAFGRGINDAMSDEGRQQLKIFIPRLGGTVDHEAVIPRAEYLAWQAIRVFAPLALDAAGLTSRAAELRRFDGTLKEAARLAVIIAADATSEANWAAASAARAAGAASETSAASTARAAKAAKAASPGIAAGAASEAAMIAAMEGALAIGRQAEPIAPARIVSVQRSFARAGALSR